MISRVLILVLAWLTACSATQTSAGSRDFKAWLDAIPADAWGNSGIKVLLTNMNPSVTAADAAQFEVDMTAAAKDYPEFCNTGDEWKDQQELAAFLSIIGAETSFATNAGFPCTTEIGCPRCEVCSYNSAGKECETDPKKQYYGRGPLQLSWDFNYRNYSRAKYGGDESVLLDNPDLVTASGTSCWASAMWFWMTPQRYGGWCMPEAAWSGFNTCNDTCPEGPSGCGTSGCDSSHWVKKGTKSPHDAIHSGSGMPQVIAIINGGYDCCPTSTYANRYGHVNHRMWWFLDQLKTWAGKFPYTNLDSIPMPDCPLGDGMNCGGMDPGPAWNNPCTC